MGRDFRIVAKREDERVAYGWAQVSATAAGERIVDLQGDLVEPAELERASIDFMLTSRDSGVMHRGAPVASVVASLVTTPEILKALGVPEGLLPCGWFIGVKVHDSAVWKRVRDGELKMFSIEGRADREGVAA